MKILSIVIATLLAAPEAQAIVGAAADGAPYLDRIVMVLSRGGGGGGFCTGVSLAPRVVLTAAHCLKRSHDVAIAYFDDQSQPVGVAVVAVARHPAFHEDAIRRRLVSVDIALLELASPLPAKFRSVEIAAAPPLVGDTLVVAGFGLGREGDAKTGGVARSADLTAAEPASGVTLWAEDAKATGLGACAGDSGGPIFNAEGRLAAIVAWTNGALGKKCGLITQGPLLTPARAWIADLMERWGR